MSGRAAWSAPARDGWRKKGLHEGGRARLPGIAHRQPGDPIVAGRDNLLLRAASGDCDRPLRAAIRGELREFLLAVGHELALHVCLAVLVA